MAIIDGMTTPTNTSKDFTNAPQTIGKRKRPSVSDQTNGSSLITPTASEALGGEKLASLLEDLLVVLKRYVVRRNQDFTNKKITDRLFKVATLILPF